MLIFMRVYGYFMAAVCHARLHDIISVIGTSSFGSILHAEDADLAQLTVYSCAWFYCFILRLKLFLPFPFGPEKRFLASHHLCAPLILTLFVCLCSPM